jgi:hypothetical protein
VPAPVYSRGQTTDQSEAAHRENAPLRKVEVGHVSLYVQRGKAPNLRTIASVVG